MAPMPTRASVMSPQTAITPDTESSRTSASFTVASLTRPGAGIRIGVAPKAPANSVVSRLACTCPLGTPRPPIIWTTRSTACWPRAGMRSTAASTDSLHEVMPTTCPRVRVTPR